MIYINAKGELSHLAQRKSKATRILGCFTRSLIALIAGFGALQAAPVLIEAESMRLDGFHIRGIGFLSGQRYIQVDNGGDYTGTASTVYTGPDMLANIDVSYLDEKDGACRYTLELNNQILATWLADQRLEGGGVTVGNRATAEVQQVSLQNGDVISLTVKRNAGEYGRVDYIAIKPIIEAESWQRYGFKKPTNANASGGRTLFSSRAAESYAHYTFSGTEGYYSIRTFYLDENDGEVPYRFLVDNMEIDSWVADEALSNTGNLWTHHLTDWVYLKPGSVVTLAATRNEHEFARVDYFEFAPATGYIETCWASHFLSQASMGGTRAEIYALADRMREIGQIAACEEWIDEQFALPRGNTALADCFYHQTLCGLDSSASLNIHNFEYAWWHQAVTSPEQLRLRVGFALSQIFVTSSGFWNNSERKNIWRSYVSYYDKLLDNAFLTHRDILQDITYDPFMGVYLTLANNSKGDPALDIFPDENYAREVMQLFSCGVYSLKQNGDYQLDSSGNPIENYDNNDIRELAQVFTGLSLVNTNGTLPNFFAPEVTKVGSYVNEMQMVAAQHDNSTKELLNGVTLSASLTGDQAISAALDVLADHASTAPFLSRELIKRLTSSNPSSNYVSRVSQAWRGGGPYGNGTRGDMKSVVKAILLDEEARDVLKFQGSHNSNNISIDNVKVVSNDSLAGRVKEPILKYTQLYRYFEAEVDHPDSLILFPPRTKKAANNTNPRFGQVPMRAKSVFNFYDTEHSPGSGPIADAKSQFGFEFVSPETEILSDHVIHDFEEWLNFARKARTTVDVVRLGGEINTNFTWLQRINTAEIPMAQYMRDLNRDLSNGQMSPDIRNIIASEYQNWEGAYFEKSGRALTLLFSSPDYSIVY